MPMGTILAQTPAAGQDAADLGNMENYFSYTVMQWDAVSHVLTLGVGVFAAALVYFLVSMKDVAPRFRASNALSAVVMVSAMLILFRQAFDWETTFSFLPGIGESGRYDRVEGAGFSNGYRYMNWSIDVPVLLVQMLVVVPLAAKVKASRAAQFVIAGLAMIWTSWAAQFYEQGHRVEGVADAPFWIWYFVSWAFYLWIIVVVFKTVADSKKHLNAKASRIMSVILWLLVVSWTLYAVAIVLPRLWWDPGSGVARQYIFTFADIASKAVYGVLLSWVAMIQSKETDGYVKGAEEELASAHLRERNVSAQTMSTPPA